MVKWKCSICWEKIESEVKPPLIERLCRPCKIRHWTTVVSIYKAGGGIRYEEAKQKLAAVKKEGK